MIYYENQKKKITEVKVQRAQQALKCHGNQKTFFFFCHHGSLYMFKPFCLTEIREIKKIRNPEVTQNNAGNQVSLFFLKCKPLTTKLTDLAVIIRSYIWYAYTYRMACNC